MELVFKLQNVNVVVLKDKGKHSSVQSNPSHQQLFSTSEAVNTLCWQFRKLLSHSAGLGLGRNSILIYEYCPHEFSCALMCPTAGSVHGSTGTELHCIFTPRNATLNTLCRYLLVAAPGNVQVANCFCNYFACLCLCSRSKEDQEKKKNLVCRLTHISLFWKTYNNVGLVKYFSFLGSDLIHRDSLLKRFGRINELSCSILMTGWPGQSRAGTQVEPVQILNVYFYFLQCSLCTLHLHSWRHTSGPQRWLADFSIMTVKLDTAVDVDSAPHTTTWSRS